MRHERHGDQSDFWVSRCSRAEKRTTICPEWNTPLVSIRIRRQDFLADRELLSTHQ